MFGMLPETDPAKSLDIDYKISTVGLFLRVIDNTRFYTNNKRPERALEDLRRGLRLDWPTILAALDAGQELPQDGTGKVSSVLLSISSLKIIDQHKSDDGTARSIFSTSTGRKTRWLADCELMAGDMCYDSELGCALLYRRGQAGCTYIGKATVYSDAHERLPSELRSLYNDIRRPPILADRECPREEGRGEISLQVPYRVLAVLCSYSMLLDDFMQPT